MMIIVGIVLTASGVFAATFHYAYYFPFHHAFLAPIPSTSPLEYVIPYALVGLVFVILGSIMLIDGVLLLLINLKNDWSLHKKTL
jgi:hypothetical protein